MQACLRASSLAGLLDSSKFWGKIAKIEVVGKCLVQASFYRKNCTLIFNLFHGFFKLSYYISYKLRIFEIFLFSLLMRYILVVLSIKRAWSFAQLGVLISHGPEIKLRTKNSEIHPLQFFADARIPSIISTYDVGQIAIISLRGELRASGGTLNKWKSTSNPNLRRKETAKSPMKKLKSKDFKFKMFVLKYISTHSESFSITQLFAIFV